MTKWVAWLTGLCVMGVAAVLVLFAEGVVQAVGFLVSALGLIAIVVLDRKRPDWRPFGRG